MIRCTLIDRHRACVSIACIMRVHGHVHKRFRSSVEKRIVEIDGQFSTLLSVVYQTPHGSKHLPPYDSSETGCDKDAAPRAFLLKVFHTVRSSGVALLVEPQPSEHWEYQLDSLRKATEGVTHQSTLESRGQVELIYSDSPVSLDEAPVYTTFPSLKAIAKDPVHVALAVEKPGDGKARHAMTSILRRCLYRFRHGADDGLPYYKSGGNVPAALDLKTLIRDMSEQTAKRRVALMEKPGFADMPYFALDEFVRDVAALAIVYPSVVRRRTKNKGTVLSSLAFATSPKELQYLHNGPKYVTHQRNIAQRVCLNASSDGMSFVGVCNVSRSNTRFHPYGTAGCETVQNELVNYFRHVINQRDRHARVRGFMFTLRKLVEGGGRAAMLQRTISTDRISARLLREVVSEAVSLVERSLHRKPLGADRPM